MRGFKYALASVGVMLAVAACSSGEGEKAEAPAAEAPAPAATPVETPAPAAEAPAATETPAAAPAAAGGATVTLAGLTGNATNGQRIFGQCRTCHVVEPGVNRVGPSLHGIIGRQAGTVAGFNYSAANKGSGVTWTEEVLFEYLENPREFMPGTRMAFVGLKKPQDRADVIAYLKTQS
ncbi:MAG: cytochrome c family protein [Caulobacteraceae bacterium]|nr:cytochrome c family protein [Caulobacteraceae bacterium]